MLKNWKLGFHLLFRTARFGVNNELYARHKSIFAWPWWKIVISCVLIRPIYENWKQMKFRAGACHFMTDEDYKLTYGKNKHEY